METLQTTCCVIGGGPAGVMLGYLLARAGVPVTVLEKHNDFFRDFRGDTVHPSTLEVLYELGLLEEFLRMPHQRITSVRGAFGDFAFEAANFGRVPGHCKFVALMPQWDFLNFLSGHAKRFPCFDLRMQHEAVDLIWDIGGVTGVRANTPSGPLEIRAGLVIGCDGRHAITRHAAQLDIHEVGVPIDVLWFRISRHADDPDQLLGRINYGKALILINRGDYFQAGLIVRKGSFGDLQRAGILRFREIVLQIAPYLGQRVEELKDWNQVQLLSVQINRLHKWHRPGLLCVGDAAHAMSPAGGVGINLAIQDAVAAANLLAAPLRRRGFVTEARLACVQQRREFPTRLTQALQERAHKAFSYIFQHDGPLKAPWQMKVVTRLPGIQHVAGRMIGIGVRPEHIRDVDDSGYRQKPAIVRIAIVAGVTAGIAVCLFRLLARTPRSPMNRRAGREAS